MATARQQLTEDELKLALDHCASEPIHIPGSIQPHGMLIATNTDYVIQQISANSEEHLGVAPQACLGKNLSDFISIEQLGTLQETKTGDALQPIQSMLIMLHDKAYDVVSHQSGDSLIIEFEPNAQSIDQRGMYYDQLRNFAIGMHKAHTLNDIFDHVTAGIRRVTGFDRVKLYRFDQDWHGEVVAEAKADFMPSYKGLHFPASDIPEQARRLYMQSYLRLISNTQYRPIPILPEISPATGQPLDLSLCMLRSVSPVHIQYLDNISVQASMSVSIIQNGKLWGLVACHHNTPLHVPYPVRNVCEIMGHIFSAQLSSLEDFAQREVAEKRDRLIKKFASALDNNMGIEKLMEDAHQLATDALNADGLIVKAYTHVLKYGDVPDEKVLTKLMVWLEKLGEDTVFHTDDAPSYFKDVPGLESLTGGILAVPISLKSHDYIIWFRRAIIEEVAWAGNPEKPIEQTAAGYRLTPRSSFALWKEQVLHRSEAWSPDDVRTARSMVNVLLESEKISAQQANLAKTEFLANISHEIRTPMNAVIGLARILRDSKPLTDRQRKYIETLQFSADGLLALINDMLDISKIESRKLELESIPFDFTKLIEEIISMMSLRASEKGIAFDLDYSALRTRSFLGDPARIRQVLLNLGSNALKFTERGGIDFIIESAPSTHKPGLEKIIVTIRDTGIGIAPEKIETIFHKFVQAETSIARKYGGTGLGLAITKMLTEAMGGEIVATSELGKGSEFKVSLYLSPSEHAHEETNMQPDKDIIVQSDSPRVLLVEDYEANILVAGIYLESFGYQYDVARNGFEAVERARSTPYAAILMDVQMPELNGFEATAMIREYESKPNRIKTPIIGMTAHALAGDRERCISAGMDDYIAKPIQEDELKGKLQKHTGPQQIAPAA